MRAILLFALLISACFQSQFAHAITPQDLAKPYLYSGVKLSPDGSKIGAIVFSEGAQRLVVLDTQSFKMVGGASFRQQKEVSDFHWANNERLVIELAEISLSQSQSKNYGELFAVNYDGKRPKMVFGFSKERGSRDAWPEILHMLPNDERKILISSTPMSRSGGREPSIYQLDVYNGRLSSRVVKAPVPYASFLTNQQGEIQLAIGTKEDDLEYVYQLLDEEWKDVSSQFGGGFRPIAMNADSSEMLYVDNANQDKQGLFRLHLETGKRQAIYTHKTVSLSASDISLTVDGTQAYAALINDGYPSYVVFGKTGKEAEIFKSLLAEFQGYKVKLTSRSDDGRLWVVYVSNDVTPGTYYLYDHEGPSIKRLFTNLKHLNSAELSETIPFSFETSDKMTLHGYVTYPKGVPAEVSVPLVTMVHGGPHGVRDGWFFDREVQLLAAQGYAVLRINYRGSGGYGAAYQVAGYRQWGGRIQQDIIEATRFVIAQGGIDATRVGIMGGSFGGYSAVMASALAPDLFKATIASAGVYDLSLMYSKGDIKTRLFGESYLKRVIGEDEEELARFSPVNHVESLSGPVLIMHGEKDKRVPFIHAERLRKAMDKHNKPYVWLAMEDETHGIFSEENRLEYFNAVVDFFAQNL